jgi:hypothetical protein
VVWCIEVKVMDSRIINHKRFYAVGYHNTKADAEEQAKRIRKYGTEIVHVTYDRDVNRFIYTVWTHDKTTPVRKK